ncbi:hypothetical protein DYU11_12290 [Fibrisoma montanum]|uniref:Uncharacterized protein n=2 Tax=Fibrisoma montanum TaxID=2305895 RepID=A0A418MBK3_9BACT|nr:hypothetical protein DYU11_12290 [Fibrisoma montanum]
MHIVSRLIILLIVLLVTACNFQRRDRDKDDPEPDLSGTYRVTSVRFNANTNTSVSGTVRVSKVSTASYDVDITVNNQSIDTFQVDVRKASGKLYDMFVDNELVGDIDGTQFRFDITDSNNDRVVIIARK